jgi:hypothetical protein
MATITTRAGNGAPLENDQVDANFTNLNNDKLEAGDDMGTPSAVVLTNATGLPSTGLLDNAVINTKLRDSGALSVIGRASNSTGDPADISAGANGTVLRRDGSTLGFGAVDLGSNQAVDGTLPVSNGGTGVTTSTGTGSVVLSASPTFTGTVTIPAASVTGDVSFGDNDKAIFGAGNDLQIYHDGSGSYIDEQGNGPLYIRASNQLFLQSSAGDNYLVATAGGAVNLRHNGSIKIATTSTGIDVTGTVTSDGLTVDDVISIDTSTGSAFSSTGNLKIDIDSDNNATDRVFQITSDSGDKVLLQVEEGGDISFYEDTGTTPKFFWDASAERLGIGTSSPDDKLTLSQSHGPNITIYNPTNYGTSPGTSPSSRNDHGISWYGNLGTQFGSSNTFGEVNYIKSVLEDLGTGASVGNGLYALTFGTTYVGPGFSSVQERLRIDSSGNVLCGSDGGGDIGSPTKRWDDLHLSGTANLATIDFGDWTITESGGSLYFATGGTNKMKLDASGNLQVAGNVESNATIS